jgi:hypothetical protein
MTMKERLGASLGRRKHQQIGRGGGHRLPGALWDIEKGTWNISPGNVGDGEGGTTPPYHTEIARFWSNVFKKLGNPGCPPPCPPVPTPWLNNIKYIMLAEIMVHWPCCCEYSKIMVNMINLPDELVVFTAHFMLCS